MRQSLLELTLLSSYHACLKLFTVDVADVFTKVFPSLRYIQCRCAH